MGLKNPYYVEGAFEPHDDGELPDLEPLDTLWDPAELSACPPLRRLRVPLSRLPEGAALPGSE